MKITKALTVLTAFTLLASSASAALLVRESFDYTAVNDSLDGKGGTTEVGLSGTWSDADSNTEMFLKSGSLSFSNLQTSGNHIGYQDNTNQDRFNRSLSTTGFTQPTIYFSFLFEKLQNNFGADHEGFAVMNGLLPNARWDSGNDGAIGRDGFAVAAVNDGSNLQAVAYDGTTGTRVVSSESIGISVVNGGSNTSTSNQAVNLIVGQISFNAGAGGADVFRLFSVTDDGTLDGSVDNIAFGDPFGTSDGDYTLVTSIEADMDESSLDTLHLTRQVNVNYDEVRIGTTFGDVTPVPEASTFALIGLSGLLLLRRRRS